MRSDSVSNLDVAPTMHALGIARRTGGARRSTAFSRCVEFALPRATAYAEAPLCGDENVRDAKGC